MVGANDDPFGRVVRMAFVDVAFERSGVLGEELEGEAKLLGAFGFSLPAVVRDDRAIDLHAGDEAGGDRTGGEGVGVVALSDGGPSDEKRRRGRWGGHGEWRAAVGAGTEARGAGEIDP